MKFVKNYDFHAENNRLQFSMRHKLKILTLNHIFLASQQSVFQKNSHFITTNSALVK